MLCRVYRREFMSETFKHKGLRISIEQDIDVESPRGDYNVGTMVCFHKRYTLGDKHHYSANDYSGWDEIAAAIEREEGPLAVILPLRLFDHSGISMSVGSGAHACDPGGWDSGQVGWIFATKKKAVEEWGKKLCTKRVIEQATEFLIGEVETYDQYLTGDVYYYSIKDESGEILDSLSGCYGFEYCKEEAIASADGLIERRGIEAIESAGDIPLYRIGARA
jgi:hypothetical protein